MQGWYYLTVCVKVLFTLEVYNRRFVDTLCYMKGALHCAASCLPKYIRRTVVKVKFFTWRHVLISSIGKCIESPIFCPIGGLQVKYDVRGPFVCHHIAFFKTFPLNTTRIIHKPESIESGENEPNLVQLLIRVVQSLAKLSCSITKLSAWNCHQNFTKDRFVRKVARMFKDQRTVIVSH